MSQPPAGAALPTHAETLVNQHIVTTTTTTGKPTSPPSFFRRLCATRLPYFSEPVGVLLLFLLIVAANGAAVAAKSGSGLNEIAVLFGFLGLADTLILLILIMRNSFIYSLFGVSVDQALVLHRWLGWLVFVCITLHRGMGLFWVYWHNNPPASNSLNSALINTTTTAAPVTRKRKESGEGYTIADTWKVSFLIWGFTAWCALLAVVVFSLPIVRRRGYDLFLASHLLIFAYFVAATAHDAASVAFFIIGMLFVFYDKVKQWFRLRNRFTVTSIDTTHTDLVKLRFRGTLPRQHKPAQYVFLCVPSMSKLQWHPFTISSTPSCQEHEVCIRALGDYTQTLFQTCKAAKSALNPPLQVSVDGPYGSAGPACAFSSAPVKMLIVGGIGVTPAISLLRYFFNQSQSGSLLSNTLSTAPGPANFEISLDAITSTENTSVDLNQAPHVESTRSHVYFVWTVAHQDQYEWFRVELEAISAAVRANPSLPRLTMSIHVTRDAKSLPPPCQPGRPNVPMILETATNQHASEICVFTCGPSTLVDTTWDGVTRLQHRGKNIVCVRETFEF
eukprot:m.229488 g.229488  ORF g.229488 m.229488 type:complete len:561 (+) comp17756_c0_seq1:183-1865(+)